MARVPNYPIIHPDYYPSYPNYDTAIFVGKNLINVWCKNRCVTQTQRKRSEHSTHATLSTVGIDMGALGSNAWLENLMSANLLMRPKTLDLSLKKILKMSTLWLFNIAMV